MLDSPFSVFDLYEAASKTGSQKRMRRFSAIFPFFLRTWNRKKMVNVLHFNNITPTAYTALIISKKRSAPDRLAPREVELMHFRDENVANISLEKWGFRVEELSKFHLQEYLVYQKT